ncbi:hypothetical protein BD560DRAFT_177731 [Blakeslea trispora]|nr:hypothetical protein BD560DRAFT_177731 [Blakeslea trispora]
MSVTFPCVFFGFFFSFLFYLKSMSSFEDKRPTKRQRVIQETPPVDPFSRIKHLIDSCFRYLATPDIPIIISSYLRVIMRAIGIFAILFITYQLLRSLTAEIESRCQLKLEEYAEKARQCHQNYVKHQCGPELAGAVWQSICSEWDKYPFTREREKEKQKKRNNK